MAISPSSLLLVGAAIAASAYIYTIRRTWNRGWPGFEVEPVRIAGLALIVLGVSDAVSRFGWLPVYAFLIAVLVVQPILTYAIPQAHTLDRHLSTSPMKVIHLSALLLIASTALTSMAELSLVSPALVISLIAAAAITTSLRLKTVSRMAGLAAILSGMVAGTVIQGEGGSISALISGGSIAIILLSIYLIYVAGYGRYEGLAGLANIPITASLLPAGIAALIASPTDMPAQPISAGEAQVMPLMLAFTFLGGLARLSSTTEKRGSLWLEPLIGVLVLAIIASSSNIAGGPSSFQAGAASVLAAFLGEIAVGAISRFYGVIIALAAAIILAASHTHLVKTAGRREARKPLLAAIFLAAVYYLSFFDGWKTLLPYAGGLTLLATSLMLLISGLAMPRKGLFLSLPGLGLLIYTASTLIWLALNELSTLGQLLSAGPPILSLVSSGLALWMAADLIARRMLRNPL
ncbi:hypothetical protein HRbin01_00825 [archaeon HR01]|nr:hypothetical protein HRbin01_00825 [archaeon HR01]